mmetsp:Transcript_115957/g.368798  ORF Transcript_115957/g.368798 Transcript_115957/m.368798 type:complete len:749 (-) Transcript_115957:96-2342(-)
MATSDEWPMQCACCKNKVKEESECFGLWKCRQDHYFVCCTVECQRMFDKRCHKVMDAIEKRERKINNEGQMNALRRLPPAEREKLKQKSEAEGHDDWLICPADVKVTDRSVPSCAFCMQQIGGYGKKESPSAKAPPPPARGGPSPTSAPPPPPPAAGMSDLLDDDMLVVLKKDDDVVDEDDATLPSKKKGKVKKGKDKKQNVLLLDCYDQYRQAHDLDEAEAPASRTSSAAQPSPGLRQASSGVSAWAAGRPGATQDFAAVAQPRGQQPPEFLMKDQSKVQSLVDMVGCTEERARLLLEQNHWNLEQAADSFFYDPRPAGGGEGGEVTSSIPRWGPRQGVAAAQGGQAQAQASPGLAQGLPGRGPGQGQGQAAATASPAVAAAAATAAAAEAVPSSQTQAPAETAHSQAPPAPPQQPPPPCPSLGWKAVWSEDNHAHYYWHMKTNKTQWELPEGMVASAPAADEQSRLAEEQAAAAEQQQRLEGQRRAAEQRAAEQQADLERRRDEAEALRRKNLIVEAAHITGADEAKARARLEAQGWDLEAAVKMLAAEMDMDRRRAQQQEQVAKIQRQEQLKQQKGGQASVASSSATSQGDVFVGDGPWERICVRHWRPLPNVQNTMRLLQGERVSVSWTDSDAAGWAWGSTFDDVAKEGYFPQAVLEPVTREPRVRSMNETCGISTRFEAPHEIGGYLSVAVGDTVQLLHPMEKPYSWAYAKRVSEGGEFGQDDLDVGWVPEAVLCDLDAHPAG